MKLQELDADFRGFSPTEMVHIRKEYRKEFVRVWSDELIENPDSNNESRKVSASFTAGTIVADANLIKCELHADKLLFTKE